MPTSDRHARIIANLTRPIPARYKPPPKPRSTYLKLRPGDRLMTSMGVIWAVHSCDSGGMWLTVENADGFGLASSRYWTGPWDTTFRKLPKPRKKSKKSC